MTSLPSVAEMQRAYQRRDASYDGLFFVAVRTTGVFCRPMCPARSPKPANVEFFATAEAARAAGYRPCKRCRPTADARHPDWAAELLAEIDGNPSQRLTEADLRARGVDPATVRRHFQRNYGMTFQAFTRARRLSAALSAIQSGADLDRAALGSGYESHSGFREAFAKLFDAPPGRLRRGGGSVALSWLSTPLGPMVAGATAEGVCLLEFSEPDRLRAQVAALGRWFRVPVLPGSNEFLDRLKGELAEYFAGGRRCFGVPLVAPGTPFQQRVWAALLTIPYGQTCAYHDIAVALGNAKAVRAVGRANGLNRLCILIPCHRVVNKSGDLGGYGGGLRRKQFLLDLERRSPAC